MQQARAACFYSGLNVKIFTPNAERLEKVLDELVIKRHTKVEIWVLHGHVGRQPLPNLERSRNWEACLLEKEIKQHALTTPSY